MKDIEPVRMHCLRKSLFSIVLLLFIKFSTGKEIYSLSTGQTLKDGDVLISIKGAFTLRFFGTRMSANRYLGIHYSTVSENIVVWVANRDNPVNGTTGVVSFVTPNKLVIYGSGLKVPIWSTSFLGPGKSYSAQLLDTGNLVVFGEGEKGVIAWQSFDHPTDTWLPEMKLGLNRKTGLSRSLRSWKSLDDTGAGNYSFRMDDGNRELSEFSLYNGSDRIWRSGPLNGGGQFITEMSLQITLNLTYVRNEVEDYMMYSVLQSEMKSIVVLKHYGTAIWRVKYSGSHPWEVIWQAPIVLCDQYGACGPNGNCYAPSTETPVVICNCLPGSEAKSQHHVSAGCVRKRDRNDCRNGEGFLKLSRTEMPDTATARVDRIQGLQECEELCLRDCNCTAYTNVLKMGNACVMWYGDLMDTKHFGKSGNTLDLYVRADVNGTKIRKKQHHYSSSKKKLKVAAVATSVGVVAASIAIFILFWQRRKRKRGLRSRAEQRPANNWTKEVFDANETNGNIQFIDLISLVEATNNFCDESKLGRGGFGTVYKGTLNDGYVIAVKRLSETSRQGMVEFKNEATLVSRLQHMNLVRLLGCCAEQNEKILIYEYMPNGSLDSLIFDPEKSPCLDWEKRFNIIMGITRGMMYLHNDSRVKIIHRDLKASNILLDAHMNPKVSDFGMARFFDNNEVEAITRTVVGTYGYMSPEYLFRGIFSAKFDVYSFGVLLLEIMSGRKNSTYINEETVNLIDLAWSLRRRALEIVDLSMGDYPAKTVQRCIHVGLLCVQRNPDHRPTMSEVFVMLSNEQTDLPTPQPPGIVHYPPPTENSSSSDYTSLNDYMPSSSDYMPSSSSEARNDSCNDLTYSEIIPR